MKKVNKHRSAADLVIYIAGFTEDYYDFFVCFFLCVY